MSNKRCGGPFTIDQLFRFLVLAIGANCIIGLATSARSGAVTLRRGVTSSFLVENRVLIPTLHFLSLHLWQALTTRLLTSRQSEAQSEGFLAFVLGITTRKNRRK